MASSPESLPSGLLRKLAHLLYRHPRAVFYPQIVLAAICVVYTVTSLKFSTKRNDLVGADKKYHQNFLRFAEEFAVQDDLVAVVESEDAEKNRQFVERLGARLQRETNLFGPTYFKGNLKMLGPKAFLFLPEETLKVLQTTLHSYRPFIQEFTQSTNLDSLFQTVNRQFRAAVSSPETNTSNSSLMQSLPALTRVVRQTTDSLNRSGVPPSPGVTALFNRAPDSANSEYLTFAHGRIFVVSTVPASPNVTGAAIGRLRALVNEVMEEIPGVNAGVTGESVLELDEMEQSARDTLWATILSLALVALIFVFGYNEIERPLKTTCSLLVGLSYTMGYTTLVVGRLNILTITFVPILVGLAIDFGVHLVSRFEEELAAGRGEKTALEKALIFTGLGILSGCLTTAGSFFAMALTDFKGIQEMGLITGGGMVLCLVPMMTFLPAWLLKGSGGKHRTESRPAPAHRARLENLWLSRPRVVVLATLVVCAVCATQSSKIFFDYNLLNMQSKGIPAVEFERKLTDGASRSLLYGAVVANSTAEGAELEAKLELLPSVESVQGISRLLSENQERKLDRVKEIKAEVATIVFPATVETLSSPAALSQTLQYTRAYFGIATNELRNSNQPELLAQIHQLMSEIAALRERLAKGNPDEVARKLTAFERALFADLRQTFDSMKEQESDGGLRVDDLPPFLKARFVGTTGKQLIQVFPKGNVWERSDQAEFVRQLRTVDENATGTPVQLYEYTGLLRQSYQTAAWYALAAIAFMVLLHFRSLLLVALALLPVAIGSIWTLGLMGLFHIPFNPANIMTLPLVIGIGVTNGIHVINRFVEERDPSIFARSTGKAVLVSGLTTIAGFGSLIPAKHQGIASLGLVMSIGVAACMIAGLTFLPALMKITVARVQRKHPTAN